MIKTALFKSSRSLESPWIEHETPREKYHGTKECGRDRVGSAIPYDYFIFAHKTNHNIVPELPGLPRLSSCRRFLAIKLLSPPSTCPEIMISSMHRPGREQTIPVCPRKAHEWILMLNRSTKRLYPWHSSRRMGQTHLDSLRGSSAKPSRYRCAFSRMRDSKSC